MAHYSDHRDLLSALVHFNQHARVHGLAVGIGDAVRLAELSSGILWKDEPYFKHALQSICCKSYDDIDVFDSIYETYWSQKGTRLKNKTHFKNQSNFFKKNKGTVAMLGTAPKPETDKDQEAKNTSGANSKELLRKTDFALIKKIDEREIEELCDQLVRELSMRLRRRMSRDIRGAIDLRGTMRKGIPYGGSFIELVRKKKREEKIKLVLLLDVSGSMDKYSFYLLRFIWSLRQHFRAVEAFTFSTKLMRMTELLKTSDLQGLLQVLSAQSKHWSGGTKIGSCLSSFYDIYGKRVLNGRCMTIVLSDGLETGSTEELEMALERIKRKSKKLIWLNPLKGMQGFEPVQKGMSVAMPKLDYFASAHNLDSLMQLENILSYA